jgi:CubicO group peptidase (beta-lactamase class C family)
VPELAVARLLAAASRAGMVAGAVACWGRRDEPMLASAGQAVLRPAALSLTEDTWFDLASLTKPLVTTTLALLGFRSGALTPTTTVGEVLDETRGSAVGGLELGRLLTHTAGLPAWLPLYCLTEGDPRRTPACLARLELAAQPGKRVIYSCIGFIITGLMLERAAAVGLAELAGRHILRPLGLEEHLAFNPDPARRHLAGHAAAPASEQRLVRERGLDPRWIPATGEGRPDDGNARFLGGAAGNAGLFGTAHGVWRLAAEYLEGGGRLLKPEEAAAATASLTPGLGQERGLGWQLAATAGCSAGPALAPTAFGHSGFTGVSLWAEGVNRARFVLLANRVHPGHRAIELHPLRRRFHRLAAGS